MVCVGCLDYFFFVFFMKNLCCFCFCFFFSSRRRHTRLVSDWSSDVCSSDLSYLSKHIALLFSPYMGHLMLRIFSVYSYLEI